jgi:hypothetical protein
LELASLWSTIESLTQPLDELQIAIGIDKGGISTKLLLTWLNHDQPQSDDASLMLGLYEGNEDHSFISLVFRQLLAIIGHPPVGWCIKLSTNNKKAVPSSSFNNIMSSHHCASCHLIV